jgi:APA family basic amino acid/polyamine antiporter
VLMIMLPMATWWRFLVWMGLGLVVYFLYSMHRSRLGRTESPE